MNIVVIGQKEFARQVAALVDETPGCHLIACAGVIRPERPDRLHVHAQERGVPFLSSRKLRAAELQAACKGRAIDLILVAHCHDFIRREVRELAHHGAIGYHPSLLPAYKGKTAIQDQLDAGETVLGGSLYRLDDGWDTGEVIAQQSVECSRSISPETVWRELLFPSGLSLFQKLLSHCF